jgi:hypothetical protein
VEVEKVVDSYLNLLDSQREAALAALDGLAEEQIWQRPTPREWSIGEILSHNYLLIASTLPYVRFAWRCFHWYGSSRRARPYQADAPDVYRRSRFPMWVGFLWTPRHNAHRPVSLEQLKTELRDLHRQVRDFYAGKDETVLGNISLYDPYFGWLNLIITLRIGIYHDQLHYDDVVKLAQSLMPRTAMDEIAR